MPPDSAPPERVTLHFCSKHGGPYLRPSCPGLVPKGYGPSPGELVRCRPPFTNSGSLTGETYVRSGAHVSREAPEGANPPREPGELSTARVTARVEWEAIGAPDDPQPRVVVERLPGVRIIFGRETKTMPWSSGEPEWMLTVVEVTEGTGREAKRGHEHEPGPLTAPCVLADPSEELGDAAEGGPLVEWLEGLVTAAGGDEGEDG